MASGQVCVHPYDMSRSNIFLLGVGFRLVIDFHITGLIGEQHAAANIANAECPIQLSLNAG